MQILFLSHPVYVRKIIILKHINKFLLQKEICYSVILPLFHNFDVLKTFKILLTSCADMFIGYFVHQTLAHASQKLYSLLYMSQKQFSKTKYTLASVLTFRVLLLCHKHPPNGLYETFLAVPL